jgi:ATPase family protein associated with various cellular activities (AAA)/winged helix domain-containing protein
MERLWNDGQSSPDQGLAIQPGEVRRILTSPQIEAEKYRSFLREEEPARLAKIAEAADQELAENAFWISTGENFQLTACEKDLLALCVAVEMDPRLGRVLAYLADDTRATQPTTAAAAALFDWEDGLPAQMTGLLRWRLARPATAEAISKSATAWEVDLAVVLSVKSETWVDPSLADSVQVIASEKARQQPCLYPAVLARMIAELSSEVALNRAGKNGGSEIDAVITGLDGSGRETLAAQFATAIGKHLLSVKTPLLQAAASAEAKIAETRIVETKIDALIRAARLARATGAVLYWRDSDSVTSQEWTELKLLACPSLRGASTPPAGATQYALPPLSLAQRLALWAQHSEAQPPAIVRTQRLTPAEIKHLAQHAPGDPAYSGLRRTSQPHSDLMQPLPCPYSWDDLVVPPTVRRLLKDFEAQVVLRWEVYEEWGFSRLTHLGQGISGLFGGPSGTGKTMAAQVLARSLGLELYRVDLAGVVNKYIGETEKRLREVFDTCERSGALLFFDEADALFGGRMQAKDAHDRFANIEIDYLLQRVEQFDGVAILATNRKNDLDAAFLRRLRFVVDFLNPDEKERRILWQKSLPAQTPTGETVTSNIDFDLLAEEMELTGAQIKSIALGAAFLARQEGTRIGMHHIELAARREFAKGGQLLREPMGKVGVLRTFGSESRRLSNG